MRSFPVPPSNRFPRHPLARALGDLPSGAPGNPERRDFLRGGLAAGLAMGIPSFMAGCGGGANEVPAGTEPRTLFFNLSHLDLAGKSHFVVAAGRRHTLVATSDNPAVLANARQSSAFLQDMPDSQITHHAADIPLPIDSVTICYHYVDIDVSLGTWSMTGVFFHIPPSASVAAYQHARARAGDGPLPLSAKRRHYGMRAAQTEADLRDENLVVDFASYAAAMVGSHPEIMSLDATSAHVVHSSYINVDINTIVLTEMLANPRYGPAQPAVDSLDKNKTGWGTLRPVTDFDGSTMVNQQGANRGRILYQPAFHPDIVQTAGAAAKVVLPAIKNDTTLGGDVTGRLPLADINAAAPDPSLAGNLWFRHDGIANFAEPAEPSSPPPAVGMTLKNGTPGAWLWPSATSTVNADNSVQLSLDLLNWGLRFLGVYVQFISNKTNPPTVLNLSDIPEYQNGTIVPGHNTGLDTQQEMFLGLLGPVFTILGIPTWPGFLLPKLKVPKDVDVVRVLSGGLAFHGPNPYPQTVIAGAVMTGIFNYGVTSLMAGLGAAAAIPDLINDGVVPIGSALIQELIAAISSFLNIPPGNNAQFSSAMTTAGFWEAQGLALARFLISTGSTLAIKALARVIARDLAAGVIADEAPIVGWIMLGVSIGLGVISLAETSVEVGLSPWTFVDDVTFTHDLAVTIKPDPDDGSFPAAADRYTVIAQFDEGTPRVKNFTISSKAPKALPTVLFHGVPLGGQVNVSVAFHQAGTATTVDVLVAKGSTGLVPNDASNKVPDIQITELKFPINASTVYRHKQKTTIDNGGVHRWIAGPVPSASNGSGSGPGTISSWNGITVRQSTSQPPRAGYVGYAWRGQSTDPSKGAACRGGGTGQLDIVANLNTDDASLGYATTPCGLDPNVRVAYNLLSHGTSNFYLDTADRNAPMLRQVTLDPAVSFDHPFPSATRSWGVLNFESDVLLLHPAGHVISFNSANHKMETHRLPLSPLDDATAKTQLRAQVRASVGSRPGLLTAPKHAVVVPDGTIVVLEEGDSKTPARLQALNLSGNPVRYFRGQSLPYFLTLAATPREDWIYLDLAVEFTGFLYVLSQKPDASQYRLDIYHPTQTGTQPISTTTGFNAARIAIDFWRNLYALNYEVLPLPAPGLAEPSVSLWVPSQSCTGYNCTPTG